MMKGPAQRPAPDLAGALALVDRHVRLRFSVNRDAFAARLAELGAALPGDASMERTTALRLDDLYLATACAQGDERAWEEFGQSHFGFMRDFARRFLPDAQAFDLADQVIAELWEGRKLARYEGRSRLRTWLGAVVAHAALNVLERQRRTDSPAAEPFTAAGPDRDAGRAAPAEPVDRESADLLARFTRDALAALGAEDRLLMLLYYERGLTLDEAAAVLSTSKATLSRRLKRARTTLHAAIDAAARHAVGATAEFIRRGVDLARLDLDLHQVLAIEPVKRDPSTSV